MIPGLVQATTDTLLACTACVGDPGSVETRALALGILALLGVVAPVQVVIVRFFWRLLKAEEEGSIGEEAAS